MVATASSLYLESTVLLLHQHICSLTAHGRTCLVTCNTIPYTDTVLCKLKTLLGSATHSHATAVIIQEQDALACIKMEKFPFHKHANIFITLFC